MSTIEKHDMTQGKILLPLVSFTIPLVLGNLFQLTYNAADSVIVGKYVGEQALAAVGTSTPIMNIAILLISGMCMGASVLMSSQYGAKDYDTLSRQISTTMLAGCAEMARQSWIYAFIFPAWVVELNRRNSIVPFWNTLCRFRQW